MSRHLAEDDFAETKAFWLTHVSPFVDSPKFPDHAEVVMCYRWHVFDIVIPIISGLQLCVLCIVCCVTGEN